jgi:hypothetical protein
MAFTLAPAVVDALLLGPESRRRQLQDFPVLGDVWSRFAERPDEAHDLLIIPTRERPTGEVVAMIAKAGHDGDPARGSAVAYLQDLVVASFRLHNLYGVLIPATAWWDRIEESWRGETPDEPELARWIRLELRESLGWRAGALGVEASDEALAAFDRLTTDRRQAAKLGLLLGIFLAAAAAEAPAGEGARPAAIPTIEAAVEQLGLERIVARGAGAIRAIIDRHEAFEATTDRRDWQGVIFQVTLNRDAAPAISESVPAIKADAARQLFRISCADIAWGVLDSGIDHRHPAFRDHRPEAPRPHRVRAAYEFRRIRAILGVGEAEVAAVAREIAGQSALPEPRIAERLREVEKNRLAGKPVDWELIQPLITIDLEAPSAKRPDHPHGTHVAGIIGADWRTPAVEARPASETDGAYVPARPARPETIEMQGVCPDIALFDFRVIGSTLGDSEFAVSAALQFVRWLNEQSGPRIHGLNMSLAIRHNVRNYACGRTPVCVQAEALIANGVVVVAAAGNRGYQQYQLADSTTFESYAASSITDPGNADGVITVGATHRQWPHTYGVSFFSSRGPTGDGRMKPDLLAPGEKIVSCIPGERQDQMDGTSMAAPHVSGAAALLMARHKELKGQPARIKEILCSTATDLKRERSFQGHGMVDVLRAIQSV